MEMKMKEPQMLSLEKNLACEFASSVILDSSAYLATPGLSFLIYNSSSTYNVMGIKKKVYEKGPYQL